MVEEEAIPRKETEERKIENDFTNVREIVNDSNV